MIIAIPEELREMLGPDGSRALAELLNEVTVRSRADVIEIAASRFEHRLAEEVGRLRADLGAFEARISERVSAGEGRTGERVSTLEVRIGERMSALEVRMGERVSAGETRLLRWIVGLSLTQFSLLLGVLFAVLKL